MRLARVRGVLLRLVRHRLLAVSAGAALMLPALWLELSGRYGAWWVDGLSLVLGATGVVPDWIDEGSG